MAFSKTDRPPPTAWGCGGSVGPPPPPPIHPTRVIDRKQRPGKRLDDAGHVRERVAPGPEGWRPGGGTPRTTAIGIGAGQQTISGEGGMLRRIWGVQKVRLRMRVGKMEIFPPSSMMSLTAGDERLRSTQSLVTLWASRLPPGSWWRLIPRAYGGRPITREGRITILFPSSPPQQIGPLLRMPKPTTGLFAVT